MSWSGSDPPTVMIVRSGPSDSWVATMGATSRMGVVEGQGKPYPGEEGVAGAGDRVGDQLSRVRGVAQVDHLAGGLDVDHPVGAEGPPGRAFDVAGHEVPVDAGVDQTVRVDAPDRGDAVRVAVGERGAFGCPAHGGQQQQHIRGGPGRLAARGVFDGGVQALQAPGHPDGQNLAEFQQSRQGRRIRAECRALRCFPQRHGHGEHLVVVQAQWWHAVARAEAVAAARAGDRLDAVAEFAQPVDVPAHRAVGDVQVPGQIRVGPRGSGGEQRDQPQQPCGGSDHRPSRPRVRCSATRTGTPRNG